MIATGESQEGMTDEEIVTNTLMLLLAGHLPMRNAIGNAVWLLLSRPEQAAAVARDLVAAGGQSGSSADRNGSPQNRDLMSNTRKVDDHVALSDSHDELREQRYPRRRLLQSAK
jgi:cytochrome P450